MTSRIRNTIIASALLAIVAVLFFIAIPFTSRFAPSQMYTPRKRLQIAKQQDARLNAGKPVRMNSDLKILRHDICTTGATGEQGICGEIINNSGSSYTFIAIQADFLDSTGQVSATDQISICNDGRILKAKEKITFRFDNMPERFSSYSLKIHSARGCG